MNGFKIYLLSLLTLSIAFISCEPNVVFEKAMPPEVEAISNIPDLYHGVYMCESDSSLIYVSDQLVYQETMVDITTSISAVKESEYCSIVDGGIILPGRKECIPFTYVTDDIIKLRIAEIDTLFNFKEGQVAKYYKQVLYLNLLSENQFWVTFVITEQGDGSLLWEFIDIPDKQKAVESITKDYKTTEGKDSATVYVLDPTQAEFEKIDSRDFKSMCDRLIPVNFESGLFDPK